LGIRTALGSRMDLALLLLFVAYTAFVAWVVFLNGAEILEGTIKSAFVIAPRAIWWSATGIRLYAGLVWLGSVLRLTVLHAW